MDATGWDDRYEARELVWSAGPNRFVEEELRGLTPGRAADLGAGEGRNAIWLAEQGWEVVALDFSPVGLEKARELAERRGVEIGTRVADLTSDELEADAYDLVVIAYLQLSAEALTPIHRMAARALRPGGTVLVVGHDADNLEHGVGGPQDPSVLLTVEQVVTDLEAEGLTVQRTDQVKREVDTEYGTARAIDTLVRAQRLTEG